MPRILTPIFTFFVLLVLCVPALAPLFEGDMLRTDDGTIHLYRVIALDHSIAADGAIWPRYSSGLAYGYGAPLFNYFPPTAYYPAVALHQIGLSYVHSWLASLGLYLIVAALGAYLLGRIWSNVHGGLLCAAAYLYAPYLLFDAYTRGTITEVAALAVLPWVMCAFTRLAWSGRRVDFTLAVSLFALFIPIHNIVTLHGTILLMVYCLFLALNGQKRWQRLTQLGLAGAIAVLLTAFFWLPALGETSATKLDGVVANLNFIDPANTLRPLSAILALPHTYDPTQQQQAIPITMGWPQLLLALTSILFFVRRRANNADAPTRGLLLLMWLVVVVTVLLQIPQAAWVWEHLPLLSYSQFAWRVMGLPSLALAVLSGVSAGLLLTQIAIQWRKTAAICVLYALIVVLAIPWLYAPYFAPDALSIRDAQAHERATGELALSSFSEYLPFWNQAPLDPEHLQDSFALADVVPRLQPNAAVMVRDVEWQGIAATLSINASEPTTLTFDWLYMPSWAANIAQETLTVVPTEPHGFVSVSVPSGEYTLTVALRATPLQQVAHTLSLLGLLAFALVLRVAWHVWEPTHTPRSSTRPSLVQMGALSSTAIVVLAIKILVIDVVPNPLRMARLVDGELREVENALSADFSGAIRLLGYEVTNTVQSGSTAQIRLFWTLTGAELMRDYSSSVHLHDGVGNQIAQGGSFTPGGTATSNWRSGLYLVETVDFVIPDYTSPGNYNLDVGLFDAETLVGLDVRNAAGNPIGQRISLGDVQVTRPDVQPQWDGALVNLGVVDLVDVEGIPETAQVGDQIDLAWLWALRDVVSEPMQATLLWQRDGVTVAASDPRPLVIDWPVENWLTGDVWRGQHQLFVPGNLIAGTYALSVQIDAHEALLATVNITEPQRVYTLPDVPNMTDVAWANGIILSGYAVAGERLTLYWQADALIAENLRLFVQAVDESDNIIALTDGIPAEGTRPATSWDVGEIIVTNHDLVGFNTGEHRVRVGWYVARSGERVAVEEGDAIFLPDLPR